MERKSFAFSFIRVFLSLVLIISLMPAVSQPAFADDADEFQSIVTQADDTAAANDATDDARDEAAAQESEQGTSEQAEAIAAPAEEPVAQTDEQPEAKPLGFVYFGETDLTAGADQVVAVAIDDDSLVISSATLTYTDPRGTKHEVTSEKCADAAALFTVPTARFGTYQLIEMKAVAKTSTGQSKTVMVDLAKESSNCAFEAAPDMGTTLSAQSEAATTGEDGMTVYALNAQGEIEEKSDITAAAVAGGISAQANARAGKIVIALDPGHGGSDSGAVGPTGLKESDVNWKIAQACKAELEKYAGVEVYVTRAQNECPGLPERAQRAVDHGAKVLVSLHVNSAGATAKGAEVWYPNSSSYNKDAHVTGKELSQNILNELVALGLTKRDIKVRNSESGSKYPDGSVRDYYSVIAAARERGIPGIIVEHAFISNPTEEKKLADNAFLTKLGIADATGIAKTLGLIKGEWKQQSDGSWKYQQADGTYAKSQWVTVSGKQYWINDKGIMVTGVQQVNGTLYYFESSGAKVTTTGWYKAGSTWYYLKSGVVQTGWIKAGSAWYYLAPSTGKMATGWITDGGKRYYLSSSGAMRTGGWFKDGGAWYYLNGSGAAATGWLKTGGKWYWLDKSTGKMATGWITDGGKRYYLSSSGAMRTGGWFKDGGAWYYLNGSGAAATGWLKTGGKWYWLDKSTGKMATGWITDGGKRYYLSGSGAMRAGGWFKDGGAWYYLNGSGAAATGWLKTGGKWYWLDKSTGKMATGWTTVDGKKYYLTASGAMRTGGWFKDGGHWYWITGSGAAATGWQKIGGKWYYLDPSTTVMQTGWTKVNNAWYYLNLGNGDMKTGWLKYDGVWYYLSGSGAMLTGWQTIGGKKYYLDENGRMYTGQHMLEGQPCFFESSGEFVGHGTPIMGTSQTNAAKMAQAFIASRAVYPAAELTAGGAPDIQTFCKIIEEEAKAEGVRAEVVWAQIMHETGWLKFGGDVKVGQYNFAGIGATGGGVAGNSFPDVRTGIRAQVQHLKCYASTDKLNQAKVDPRWWDALRGKAKLVEWLGIPSNPSGTGWAADANYGSALTGLMKNKLGVK